MTGLPPPARLSLSGATSPAEDPSTDRPESATEHLREARQILALGREVASAQLETGQPVDLARWDRAMAGALERIRAAAQAVELGNF